MSEKRISGLVISNLTLEEVKELLTHVREIEQKDPSRTIFCRVLGLEAKSVEEARKIIKEIFPKRHIAG